ncbi:hypothetical protein [Aquibacillus koreensis]|uniref:hypothetical protein n=1 Tax=Aquibacillus koreensis TaxID=279446 RepID=UPI0023427F5F|nr:hypothetical protein [Aquibacillus koreensis]
MKGARSILLWPGFLYRYDADTIMVIQQGEIAEEGIYHQLISKKGIYYKMIRNQI